jgi:RNA polymerase sigma factor (sigma-70 family)
MTHASLIARLADQARSGDTPEMSNAGAWSDFIERYGDLIRGYCRKRGIDSANIEDILQDVMVNLIKAMPGFQYDPSKGRFRSYLLTITQHAMSKKVRQDHRAGALVLDERSSESNFGTHQDEQWESEWRSYHIRRALATMEAEFSARDREAFMRYAVGSDSAQVVCSDLGLSLDALYQIKSRMLRRLSALVQSQVDEEG